MLLATSANAETYFVRTSGSDGNRGIMPTQAWQTVGHAAVSAQAGDTIIVGAGIYSEQVIPAASGTQEAPLVFLADRNGDFTGTAGQVVITSGESSIVSIHETSYLQFHGLSFRGVGRRIIQSKDATGIEFHGCEFQSAVAEAVRVDGAGRVFFSGCTFRDNGGFAIKAKAQAELALDRCHLDTNAGGGIKLESNAGALRITRTRIVNNGGVALQLGGPAVVVNCLLARNGSGVEIDADGITIAFSTIVDHKRFGMVMQQGEENTLVNTIVADNRGGGIKRHSGKLRHAHNLVHGNRGGDYDGIAPGPTDMKTSPQFQDREDYALTDKSPAINGAIYLDVNVDVLGSARPLARGFDIGCHEFVPNRPNTFYVRRVGDDTNDGAKPKTAWRTISHAAKRAMPGDTVHIGAGEYKEAVVGRRAGTMERPIAFVGDEKGRHTGDAGKITLIAPGENSWAWKLVSADHTHLRGLEILGRDLPHRNGISIERSRAVRVADCELGDLESGIVTTHSEVTLENVLVRDCQPQSVLCRRGKLTAHGSRFTSNQAGLHLLDDAVANVSDCRFDDNDRCGACFQGKARISNCRFERNGQSGLWLKGIDNSQLELENAVIRQNLGYGLALDQCALDLNILHFEQLDLSHNTTGVAVLGGRVAIESAELAGNSQFAIVSQRAELSVQNSRLTSPAGGVYLLENKSCRFDATHLRGRNRGVGVVWCGGDTTLTNCVISDFETGIQMADTEHVGLVEAWNCTVGNVGRYGIVKSSGDLVLKNSIVTAREEGQIGLRVGGTGITTLSHNLLFGFAQPIEGVQFSETLIMKSPRFVNPTTRDFRLTSGSPAINAGTDASDTVVVDILGNRRPSFGAWELGAYEFVEKSGSLRVLKWQEQK